MLAGKARTQHPTFCWVWDKWQAIRDGNYKLVRNGKDNPWQLYDLSNDLSERNDLAAKKPKVVAKLERKFDAWMAEVR